MSQPSSANSNVVEHQQLGRCIDCKYDLRGLDRCVCPECGREFDWDDPFSFLPIQPFSRIRFLWPLFLMSVMFVFAMMLFTAVVSGEAGKGLAFGLLAVPGCWYAYTRRVPVRFYGVLIGVLVSIQLITQILTSDQGVVSTIGLANLFLLPYCCSVLLGCLLRTGLKRTRFAMRDYLPAIAGILLLPGFAASFAHLC